MSETAEAEPTRLTEAEWRQRAARRECGSFGHNFDIVSTGDGVPVRLVCERGCGAGPWKVEVVA